MRASPWRSSARAGTGCGFPCMRTWRGSTRRVKKCWLLTRRYTNWRQSTHGRCASWSCAISWAAQMTKPRRLSHCRAPRWIAIWSSPRRGYIAGWRPEPPPTPPLAPDRPTRGRALINNSLQELAGVADILKLIRKGRHQRIRRPIRKRPLRAIGGVLHYRLVSDIVAESLVLLVLLLAVGLDGAIELFTGSLDGVRHRDVGTGYLAGFVPLHLGFPLDHPGVLIQGLGDGLQGRPLLVSQPLGRTQLEEDQSPHCRGPRHPIDLNLRRQRPFSIVIIQIGVKHHVPRTTLRRIRAAGHLERGNRLMIPLREILQQGEPVAPQIASVGSNPRIVR